MTVSLKDVAQKAGVSVATASRALADHPRISEATKQRVRQAAAELGYMPSAIARSLVKQETRTLGVVTTTVTDPYAAELVRAVEDAAGAAGYTLLLLTSHNLPRREVAAIRALQERRVDGIIVISPRGVEHYPDILAHVTVPLVLVNHTLDHPRVRSVMADNRQGARLAVEYLVDLGYRRVAFIGGPTTSRSARERLHGYTEALRAMELPLDSRLMFPGQGRAEDGRRALLAMLDITPPPDAVLCYNDLTAYGILAQAWALGVRVPDDLAVIGFDNIPFSELTAPPLTTVAQPTEAMGHTAVALLLRWRRGEAVDTVHFDCTLVERATA